MGITFYDIIEYIGTFAFAISGIKAASIKRFDWFGAYVVGLVTAIGGGTLRDLLLGIEPFWMSNVSYLICTAVALLVVVVFGKDIFRYKYTFFAFDTVGLALFVVVGFEKSIMNDYPYWVAIIMGTLTGAAGGVFRDVLTNDVPLIFQKEIYAIACIIGGVIYMCCHLLSVDTLLCQILSFSSVILTRILAVKYDICLPVLKEPNDDSQLKLF
ncbi:MAG: trimeric intracellular cation channel family protein [Paludibacteraceae bacterium]|nr:trimeric intracellular cation channel family protein [Paludibacteraceae bacterium]MBN2787054.1 trimeric intracellular cation channel family protein [Paludibacteraceae bacterium]